MDKKKYDLNDYYGELLSDFLAVFKAEGIIICITDNAYKVFTTNNISIISITSLIFTLSKKSFSPFLYCENSFMCDSNTPEKLELRMYRHAEAKTRLHFSLHILAWTQYVRHLIGP